MAEAKLIADLLALPVKRRVKIASILLRSLDEGEADVDQKEVDAAWATESGKRVAEIRSGKVKMIPGAVVTREQSGRECDRDLNCETYCAVAGATLV